MMWVEFQGVYDSGHHGPYRWVIVRCKANKDNPESFALNRYEHRAFVGMTMFKTLYEAQEDVRKQVNKLRGKNGEVSND